MEGVLLEKVGLDFSAHGLQSREEHITMVYNHEYWLVLGAVYDAQIM